MVQRPAAVQVTTAVSDLITAITAPQSQFSEASTVTENFKAPSETDKQNRLNFLRSL